MSEVRNQRSLFLLIGTMSILSMSVLAEEVPTITVSKGDKVNLTVSPISGEEGATVTKILQSDLSLSGYFILGGNATFTASGTADSGSLRGKVVDRGGGTVLSKNYSGGASANAHHFAADIVDTLTGNKSLVGSKIAFIATRSVAPLITRSQPSPSMSIGSLYRNPSPTMPVTRM